MKTKSILTVLVVIGLLFNFHVNVNAQGFCYNQGEKMLNIGFSPFTYGFGYSYKSSSYKNTIATTFPALNVNFQIGMHEFISVGGTIGRFSRTYKSEYAHNGYVDTYKDKYSYTMIGALAEVHLDNMLESIDAGSLGLGEQFDVYVGLSMGFFISSWSSEDIWYSEYYDFNTGQLYWEKNEYSSSGSGTTVFLRSYVGGRYMFSQSFGAFLELGYASFGYTNLGVTLKMF